MRKIDRGAWFEFILMLGLLIISLVIRLIFVQSPHGVVTPPDGALYNNFASHLLHGDGFVQDARSYFIVVPPFYPLFLAFIYSVFGMENSSAVAVIQALLGALTVLFIYKTAKEIFNRWAGLFAGLLFSIYSVSIFWTGYVLTDTLFTFLIVVFVYMISRLWQPKATYWTACLLGIIWAISCLTRPHLLFFVPFLCVLLFIIRGRQVIKLLIASLLVFFFIVSSWIGYLYLKYDTFIPIASYGGLSLWLGNSSFTNPNKYFKSTLYAENPLFLQKLREAEHLSPIKQDQFYRKLALRYIVKHPLKFVENTSKKMKLFWKPVNLRLEEYLNWLGKELSRTDRWLLFLVLPGFILSILPKRDFKKNQVLLWLILYYSLIVSVNNVVSRGRVRLPIMPLVVMYGGLAISLFFYSLTKVIKFALRSFQNYRIRK